MKKPVWCIILAVAVCILSSAPSSPSAKAVGFAGRAPSLSVKIPEPPIPEFRSPDEGPSVGKFLVATDQIADPRFRESVILLIAHDGNGTVGLIINRPTKVKLSRLFPEIKALQKRPDTAFIGGPVGMEQFFMLIRSPERPDESLQVLRNVYVSTSRAALERAAGAAARRRQFRLYAGYSGWGAGQLEREIARGGWNVLRADAKTVFDKDPEKIWQELNLWNSGIRVKRENRATDLFAGGAMRSIQTL